METSSEPEYSICITNYNTFHSIRKSLESLLSQIDTRYEVIVVDNQSNDGSHIILKEFQMQGKIRLLSKPCSRGLGRQTGIQCSRGKYVITHADMDDVFKPRLNELLETYHRDFEGFLLLVQGVPGIVVAPKELIEEVGGYRDINWLEDKDLYSRVAGIGRFRFLKSFIIVSHTIFHPKKDQRLLSRIRKKYLFYREAFRLGDALVPIESWTLLPIRDPSSVFLLAGLAATLIFAFFAHWFYPSLRNKCIMFFDAENYTQTFTASQSSKKH